MSLFLPGCWYPADTLPIVLPHLVFASIPSGVRSLRETAPHGVSAGALRERLSCQMRRHHS